MSLTWPSLYNPGPELSRRLDSNPTPPGSHFLYNPNDIFRFTLYWTLIFIIPPYSICGLWALFALSSSKPLSPPNRLQQKRKRRLLGILTLFLFLLYAIGHSVFASLVIGYGLAGFYSVGKLNLSTWVPFCWALILGIINLLSLFPTFVNIT